MGDLKKKGLGKKFISGIYNYCDRWCERCSLTSKCFLYAKDQKRLAEHRRKGEDPYDWKIVMKDVAKSFKETKELILKTAKERGIDLENLPEEEYESPDPTGHPLYQRSHNYMDLARKFLERLRKSIQAFGIELPERIEIIPSSVEDVETLREIVSCHEIISWYHTQISVKVYRALGSKMEKSEDKELDEIDIYDANGSAKIAYLGVVKSIVALQKVYHWNEDLQDDALTLLVEADRLRRMIDKKFPGHRTFKRPGFDE
ncbi:hypothetical protein L6386_06915 [bacterium]|nr:hypothetical protein [bacterium]MBU4560683.1 hypothetical protein [bacterium]MCG2675912.1 hypothetical protein [bacterium]MCG2678260.1 hypothetical protein [bacterium]